MQSVSALTLVSEDIDRSRSDASIFDVAVATGDRSSHARFLPLSCLFLPRFFSISSSLSLSVIVFLGHPINSVWRLHEKWKRGRERERERERGRTIGRRLR